MKILNFFIYFQDTLHYIILCVGKHPFMFGFCKINRKLPSQKKF